MLPVRLHNRLPAHHQQQHKPIEVKNQGGNNKNVKNADIPRSNTLRGPGAMMIISSDADPTLVAVDHPFPLNDAAVLAVVRSSQKKSIFKVYTALS